MEAADAADLAEMLQFLGGLARDPARLTVSLEEFVGHPAYGIEQLRQDLERFFLLGGSDGETLFSHDTGPGLPRLRRALGGLKVVRPRAGALRALHVDPR
jgi:hypothetical protein